MPLGCLAVTVLLLNVPFGYWRANVPKRSVCWFLAVHLPIPLIIVFRYSFGVGFVWFSYPVVIGTFFFGQLIGARLKLWLADYGPAWDSSCVFKDLAKAGVLLLRPVKANPVQEQACLYAVKDEPDDIGLRTSGHIP